MRSLVGIAFALVVMLLPVSAQAGMSVFLPTNVAVDETTVSIGLRFEFGDVVKPSVVGAVRRTNTSTGNEVTGAQVDVAVPIDPDGNFSPVVRLMGVFGNPNLQGLAGVGFDFDGNKGFVGLGGQAGHFEGGVHVEFDGSLKPYVGVSTYGGPPERGTVLVEVEPE